MDMNATNTEIMKSMISTNLHLTAETRTMTHNEITGIAAALRKALHTLYPVTDKEWEEVLLDIARYADCLL